MADAITIKALQDASLDAKSLEEVVNGDENVVVTTRLGETYPSIKSVLEDTISKFGFITAEADRAEAASDAAFVNADVYPDIASGLAAVADGEQFQVPSDDGMEYIRYRRDSSTVATKVGPHYPSAKAVKDSVDFFLDKTKYFETQNLVNPSQETELGYFNEANIVKNPSYPSYYVGLDYYPAKVGDKFWVTDIRSVQFCRADKSVLWGIADSSIYIVDGIFTIPDEIGDVSLEQCAFIRIGSHLETGFSSGLVAMGTGSYYPYPVPSYPQIAGGFYSNEFIQPIIDIVERESSATRSALTGKTWVAMGDSISHFGNSYANQLSIRHNANLIKRTLDGAWVHRDPEPISPYILSEEYLTIPTENPPDLITIAGGTNDRITERLGVISDRENTTFYGALHVLLAGLRNRFPDARIGFIAPIPKASRYIEGDTTNSPYLIWKAIKEVCAYYSVPCWNGNTEYGASPSDSTTWRSTYMPDWLHPNYAGHTWYANRVEDFILSLAK